MAIKSRDVKPGEALDPTESEGLDPRVIQTKLSMALIGCRPELSKMTNAELEKLGIAVVGNDGEIAQCRIYGQLVDITEAKLLPKKQGQADDKITHGLVGFNEAVNLLTGEIFAAGIVYLPEGHHEMLLHALQGAIEAEGKGNAMLTYNLEMRSYRAGNPRGYSWRAQSLEAFKGSDPLASLRRRAHAGLTLKTLPHLPAPSPEPVSDTASI